MTFARRAHRARERARRGDMVFLDQHRVEQSNAVIAAATAAHGVFLRDAKTRQRFARVEYRRAPAANRVHIFSRRRRCHG